MATDTMLCPEICSNELLSFSENAVSSTVLNKEAPIYELDRNRYSDFYLRLPAVGKNNTSISCELILILSTCLFPRVSNPRCLLS